MRDNRGLPAVAVAAFGIPAVGDTLVTVGAAAAVAVGVLVGLAAVAAANIERR